VAITVTILMVAAALVLDFGLVRLDRQMNKAAADSATAAGVHGLDQGDGEPHPFAGVCDALEYLKLQHEMTDLPDTSQSPGNVSCPPSTAALSTVCDPADPSTWARYVATVDDLTVEIKSPYVLSDGDFPEETLGTLQDDIGDPTANGCDQLAVIITETVEPGLGSLATDANLTSRIRTVGRAEMGAEGQGAVALLMLERNDCKVLNVGSGNAQIDVLGNGPVPGLVHVDSIGNGGDCTANNIVSSQPDQGIIIRESEDDPSMPGVLGVRALVPGEPGAVPAKASDPAPKVVIETDQDPVGRELVTRAPVDDRYLQDVTNWRNIAAARFTMTQTEALATGYTTLTCAATGTIATTGKVWVDCANFSNDVTFTNATEVVFTGRISGGTNMPAATQVFVEGTPANPSGISTDGFRMHQGSATTCPSGTQPSRAVMVLGNGDFGANSSSANVQLCNTAVVLLGGSTGCLPTTSGTEPTTNSCTGVLHINGGAVDWTAPNKKASEPRDDSDWAALEDLALWTEASGQSHRLSADLRLAGVFMLPNAEPLNISGTAVVNVEEAQLVVQKLDVTGQGVLEMQPSPYDVVTVPILGGFTLVR
jgi:hypothetical protein